LLTWVLQALSSATPGFTLFTRLENLSFDWRAQLASNKPVPPADDLVVVAIDDRSHDTVRLSYQKLWPWPRYLHGHLIQELAAEGARVIAFDILFQGNFQAYEDVLDENGQPVLSDDAFARELREAGNVLLAGSTASSSADDGRWRWEPPLAQFATNALGVGHIVADIDSDGVLRRVKAYYDTEQGRVWHLGVLTAAHYLGMDMSQAEVQPGRVILKGRQGQVRVIPTDEEGYFYADWVLGWDEKRRQRIAVIPYSSLLQRFIERRNGKVPSLEDTLEIRNRAVMIGSLATGNNVSDKGATPLSNSDFLFTLHWNVVNSVVQNRFILRSGFGTESLLILLVGLLASVVTWRLRALLASSLLVVILAAYVFLALLLFGHARYWLPLALPTTAALLTHLSLVTYRGVVEQRERFRVKSVFSRVVAPDVVNELLSSESLSLGGSRRRVSVFFADIRGFTRVTDESQAEAEQVIREQGLSGVAAEEYRDTQAREILATVNLYLGTVADTIKRHHGTFDKYIGDCVMAFWGAPTDNERHAADCVRAAVDAQQAIYALNGERDEENRRRLAENDRRMRMQQAPVPLIRLLSLGCGINTGVVTVGLMGSDQHMFNYTVFGREVNLASRLEGTSGRGRVIISESTHLDLARTDPELAGVCEALPPVTVKGFREPVAVYEVEWQRLGDFAKKYDTGLVRGTDPASRARALVQTV